MPHYIPCKRELELGGLERQRQRCSDNDVGILDKHICMYITNEKDQLVTEIFRFI